MKKLNKSKAEKAWAIACIASGVVVGLVVLAMAGLYLESMIDTKPLLRGGIIVAVLWLVVVLEKAAVSAVKKLQ
jgi:F0F1-type ATP synthase assembly protein I